jgi:hypothetical protein
MKAQAQSQQQMQQGAMQQQLQIDGAKEQQITQRENQKQEAALASDIVKQAVSARLGATAPVKK